MSPGDILRFVTLPFILLGELFGIEIGRGKEETVEKLPLKTRLMSLPDNMVMAAKSSWRGRERVLAVFAGVFLASLVISTVLAWCRTLASLLAVLTSGGDIRCKGRLRRGP